MNQTKQTETMIPGCMMQSEWKNGEEQLTGENFRISGISEIDERFRLYTRLQQGLKYR
jgi:hypothetical protein